MRGLWSGLALAQAPTQPAQGSLHVPTPAERAAESAPVRPPSAAPRAGVQQVVPFSAPMPTPEAKSALGKSQPGKTVPAKPAAAHGRPGHGHPPVVAAPTPAAAREPPKPPQAAAVVEPAKPAEASKPAASEPTKGSVTGLPLPRWASLRSDDVNLRSGPGTRYPIEWEYRRRDLPVQIEREFEVWRLIQDQDGVKGWVHQATLTGRRDFVVAGAERVLRRSASDDAAPVARLEPGVLGRVRSCEASSAWCEVQVQNYRGWLKRDEIYGVYSGEAVASP
jgi:SH3-like domain-containing protein